MTSLTWPTLRFDQMTILPPGNWQDFEQLTRNICLLKWLYDFPTLHGRSGQDQFGVKRIVDDIDSIVRVVRFDGWQNIRGGECEVQKALRKTLFKYKLYTEHELFDKAYGYIREYY